jgi:hypothetical protein
VILRQIPFVPRATVQALAQCMDAAVLVRGGPAGTPTLGTGCLVTPTLVITVSYVVEPPSEPRSGIARPRVTRDRVEVGVRDVHVLSDVPIAVLVLEEPLDIGPVHLETSLSTAVVSQGWVFVIGCPRGLAEPVLSVGEIRALSDDKIDHSANTEPGSSGSALVGVDGKILGLHSEGHADVNRALRMDRILASIEASLPEVWAQISAHHGLTSKRELARLVPETPLADDGRLGYLRSASVLWSFDPKSLAPFPPAKYERTARSLLVDDVAVVTADDGTRRWMLHDDARVEGLSALGDLDAMRAARRATSAPSEGPQAIIDAVLEARPPVELSSLTTSQLGWLHAVVEWLGPFAPQLPPAAAIDRVLALRSLIDPYSTLAGPHFRGRRDDLAVLTEHVTGSAAGSRVLVVYGTGGSGKSSLLGRFLLDRCAPGRTARVPLTILDFDRAALEPSKALGIYRELLRQIALELPETAAAEATADAGAVGHKIAEACAAEGASTFLLAVDSFEEVQYRTGGGLAPSLTWLEALLAEAPQLRVVILGRAPVTGLTVAGELVRSRALGPLDDEAAHGVLEALGVSSVRARDVLVAAARGNPLTLQVGARFLARSDAQELEQALAGLPQALVQGVLYERVLERIHDARVEKLAHPGLVLRRITIDVLQHVLAPIAGVEVKTAEDAAALFQTLQRETFLASSEGAAVIVHRPELRCITLKLIEHHDRDRVAKLDRAAADWYAQQPGVEARAEELYHRLRLDEPAAVLDKVWVPGIAERLRLDPEERFPPAAARWLAAKMEAAPPSDPAPSLAQRALSQAARQLRLGDAMGTLASLGSLVQGVGGFLSVFQALGNPGHVMWTAPIPKSVRVEGSILAAQALLKTGNARGAQDAAGTAIAEARTTGDADAMFRAYVVYAWSAQGTGDHVRELEALENAIGLRVHVGEPFDSALIARAPDVVPRSTLPSPWLEPWAERTARAHGMGTKDRELQRYLLGVASQWNPTLTGVGLELWGLDGIDPAELELPTGAELEEQRWAIELAVSLFGLAHTDTTAPADASATWRRVLEQARHSEIGPRVLADVTRKAPAIGRVFASAWLTQGRKVLYSRVLDEHEASLAGRTPLLETETVQAVAAALGVLPPTEAGAALRAAIDPVLASTLPNVPDAQVKADFCFLVRAGRDPLVTWLKAAQRELRLRGADDASVADALRTLGVTDSLRGTR